MTVKSEELQRQVKLGKNLVKARDYQRAEDVFLKIIKRHKLADVYNALGALYADQGKFNFAEVAFKKALSINPNYMEAALNLSVVYNNLGLTKKSKEIYARLKDYGAKSKGAMDPMLLSKLANMHSDIGRLYQSVGEYGRAIEEYERAVDLCPHFVDIQTQLATAYRESGNSLKALKIFKKIQSKAGSYVPFWVALGVTHYARNKRADAKKAWSKALALEPQNKTAKAYIQLVA